MIPVMSASRGLGPTRPCVAWTSSEKKTVRPKPFGARARKGRHGTAIPTANPPAKGSAAPPGATPRDPPARRGLPGPPCPPGPCATEQAKYPRHQGRDGGPDLDRGAEAEADTGPEHAAGAVLAGYSPVARQVVTVEQEHRSQQAEQVQPRLEEQGLRGVQRGGEDRVAAAGHARGERAPVPDEQADQDHVGGVRAHGEHPGRGQGPRAAEHLAAQRGRHHQQHGAGRLDHREVPVRDHPVDQAQRIADVHPVVVLGESGQVTRPGQLEDPQAQAEQGGHRDDHAGTQRPGRRGGRARGDDAGTGCPGSRRHAHA